jgi:integrase
MKEFVENELVFQTGKKQGLRLSASRIRNILIPLRAIWDDACEEYRWELSNPFAYLKKYLPERSIKETS